MDNVTRSRINAVAPIRICDIGGWTDTWFAKRGTVLNISVYPYVEVQVLQRERHGEGSISINLENYDKSYDIDPKNIIYGPHPLIDAAIDSVGLHGNSSLEINIFSAAPPGASTGTSAAVTVALIGALSVYAEKQLTSYEIASLAHSVETKKLNLQCGIQDQLASAFGGINYIQMHSFPHASVSPVNIPNRTWWELENRLTLVYIGSPHSSSEIHKKVIADIGDNAEDDPRLERLRGLAGGAKNALLNGDFPAFGAIMDENTDVQRRLHPGLVCEQFERSIEIAKTYAAIGCKVNGAGGDGGSLTILGDGNAATKRLMQAALEEDGMHTIPIYLSRFGVRVW